MSVPSFELVTEADARQLAQGATIVVRRGGHITPLAADTLREKRVVVLHEAWAADAADLVPVFPVRRVTIGSDHTGVALRRHLVTRLRGHGLAVREVGPEGSDSADYPDVALAVARDVAQLEADAGVVIDGAGLGSTVAANKVNGIRAAACHDRTLARYAREHNGCQVLALGATRLSQDEADEVVDVFLSTPMSEARYIRRLHRIRLYEQTR